ncbi:hypothetical protein FB192DRAFT_1449844 [Mucor lusitanicus]|uniref:Uncharacterized protein n=2 Tax=Mucor circinelloides f. lusitanicus TaxID=29924 RepID=A0A162MPX0_MUCCL|nr:hypothetical protein FB192DRAFT_1449844 [Mucor lusitanicus]OAD04085.1 hypothetical protein MUCCIDRAFT_110964 [Mucor lusitanicus CBS 277.49]
MTLIVSTYKGLTRSATASTVSATAAPIASLTAASSHLFACYSLRSAHSTKDAASDSHVSSFEDEPSFTSTSTDN